MGRMSDVVREQFLAKTRYGYLTTLTDEVLPRTVPVWFKWDGEVVTLFTSANSPKVARIQKNPAISLLVANHLDEKEAWVAFDGEATIQFDSPLELVTELANAYWDMTDPEKVRVLGVWQEGIDHFCTIVLRPTKIRSYYD